VIDSCYASLALNDAEEVDAQGGLPEVHDVRGGLHADRLHHDGRRTEACERLGRSMAVRGASLEHMAEKAGVESAHA
jgi:hypothetical protein